MWLFVPGMSSRSAQEEEASTSLSAWHFRRLARSCTWRGMSPRPRVWLKRCRTREDSTKLLSGLTSAPSILNRGAASWILSLRASLAPTSAPPVNEKGSTGSTPASGGISGTPYAIFDRASSFWRTVTRSLFGASPRYSDPLTRSGSMRNGRLYQRACVEPLIRGTDVGLWPTPTATRYGKNKGGANPEGPDRPSLDTIASRWPTPMASDSFKRGNPTLPGAAKNWATPTAHDAKGAGTKLDVDLVSQVRMLWPTPTAMDSKSSGAANYSTESGRHTGTTLTDAVRAHQHGPLEETPQPEEPFGSDGSKWSLTLNPAFHEVLMGWPVLANSTDSSLRGMAWSRWWERWRSYLFSIVSR